MAFPKRVAPTSGVVPCGPQAASGKGPENAVVSKAMKGPAHDSSGRSSSDRATALGCNQSSTKVTVGAPALKTGFPLHGPNKSKGSTRK